jgi:predicted AAA+ superfamily ATPase
VKSDPNLFIQKLEKPVCIDEIQKAPELLESMKIFIDKHRRNGDFLIAGSANILDMKQTKNTLARRIIGIDLHPLSSKEKSNKSTENIIDNLFNKNFSIASKSYDEIANDTIIGGYPESKAQDAYRKEAMVCLLHKHVCRKRR